MVGDRVVKFLSFSGNRGGCVKFFCKVCASWAENCQAQFQLTSLVSRQTELSSNLVKSKNLFCESCLEHLLTLAPLTAIWDFTVSALLQVVSKWSWCH